MKDKAPQYDFRSLSVALLAALILSGCGAGTPSSSKLPSGGSTNNSAPAASVTPASYTFSNQLVKSSSTPAAITLTNSGSRNLGISSVTISGDFTQTNNCGSSLDAGASCTVEITFTPSATGSRSGQLKFSDNAAASPQSVFLYGTGVAAGSLQVTPEAVAFGPVMVGQTVSTVVKIMNTGGSAVTVNSLSMSGPELHLTGVSVPFTLTAGASASFDVSFSPTTTGAISGSIGVANNSADPSVTIAVSGNGAAASAHSVTLSWSASSTAVIGYYAYRGGVSGGPYLRISPALLDATSYEDLGVTAGTYYYVVTAVGPDNMESPYSDQVVATVPSP